MKATEAPDFLAPVHLAMHESMPVTPALRTFPLLKIMVEKLPGSFLSFVQPQMQGLVDMREVCLRRHSD